MQKDRLNLYLSPALCSTIREMAGNEDERISKVAEELLALGLSVKRGEMLERDSLPMIRNIVQTELHKAHAQLRLHLREDMQLELTNELKPLFRASDNRLAALLVKVFRHANIAQRLVYTVLAKMSSPDYARQIYDDAAAKAARDLRKREEEA
jgi:hypothetical protein